MKTIVLDTNILIDYANGYANWLKDLLISQDIELVLPTIVIAEYFTSSSLENTYEVNVADSMFSSFKKQDLNEEIAKILGMILRRKIYADSASTADLIIAATALYLDASLATNNKKDFDKIPKLRFFEWEEV